MKFKLWLETEKPLISDEELDGLLGSVKDVATRRFVVTRDEAQKAVDLLNRFPGLLNEIFAKYRQIFEVINEKAGMTKPFKVLPKVVGVKNLDQRIESPTKYELSEAEKNWWKTLKLKMDKALEGALHRTEEDDPWETDAEKIEFVMVDWLINLIQEIEDEDAPINYKQLLNGVYDELRISNNKGLTEIIGKLSSEIPERMQSELALAPADINKLLEAYRKLAENELKARKAAGFDPAFYVPKIARERKYKGI